MTSVENDSLSSDEYLEAKIEARVLWAGSIAAAIIVAFCGFGAAMYFRGFEPLPYLPSIVSGTLFSGCLLGVVFIYNMPQPYAGKNLRKMHADFIKGRNRILKLNGKCCLILALITVILFTLSVK